MKKMLTSAVFALGLAVAALAAEINFAPSSLPTEWISGSAPTAWAPGEITVVECWATWCGPCMRAIPHVEGLYQKLKGERIHFIGVNVRDRYDAEGLKAVLAKQRVPPTYPMAIDRAGKINTAVPFQGIPFCFVVREGKVVWRGHPMHLNEELLRKLRDGLPLE